MSDINIPMIFVVAGILWVLQLFMTYRQSMRFNDVLKPLRAQGRVAIGLGGKYYKGGRAFVAIAEKGGVVVDARVMTGVTVFAKPQDAPSLKGLSLTQLADDGDIVGMKAKVRSAAQMAANTLLKASELSE
jgi:glucitol operon activator protein